MFVSATPPSVSALTLWSEKNCQFPENSCVLFGVGVLQGSERNWVGAHVVRRPQKAHLIFLGIDIFFGKSVSALTLGGVALTNTNENLLGRIFLEG